MAASISNYVATYNKIVDAILASGPDIQDDLTDLRFIREAVVRIRDRTIKRFGLSAAEETLDDAQLAQAAADPQIVAANEKLAKAVGVSGVKGPFLDMLMQLVQIAMTNPAMLQLILSLFKKPA